MFQDTVREKIHRIQCTDNWNTYVQCKGNNSVLKENLSYPTLLIFFLSPESDATNFHLFTKMDGKLDCVYNSVVWGLHFILDQPSLYSP